MNNLFANSLFVTLFLNKLFKLIFLIGFKYSYLTPIVLFEINH